MEITINNNVLVNELRLLNKITPTKPTIAELGYILFRVDQGRCTLSATDLEVMMTAECRQARVDTDGAFLLPAKTLLDITERLTGVDVVMRQDATYISITAGAFKSRLSSARTENFPPIPAAEGDVLTLPASVLAQLIDRVRYSIPEKAQTYVITGALLTLNPTLSLVAVDGKRLSLASDSYTPTHPSSVNNVVIPAKTLDVLHDHCEGATELHFSQAANHLFFEVENRMLVSRVLDGTFPNYKPIIPQDCRIVMQIPRPALAAALRRVGVLSEESQAVDFTFEPNLLRLKSGSHTGEAVEDVPINYDGEGFTVCTNGKFVLDFLDHAIGSGIVMQFRDPASPMLLTDGDKFLNVVTILKR